MHGTHQQRLPSLRFVLPRALILDVCHRASTPVRQHDTHLVVSLAARHGSCGSTSRWALPPGRSASQQMVCAYIAI